MSKHYQSHEIPTHPQTGFYLFMRDTYTTADELVNVVYVAGYVYSMLSHSRKDEINVSDDLTQKGSKFQLSTSLVQKSACTH